TGVILGVKAPGRQGARSAHTRGMHATSSAVGRDASAARMTPVFISRPLADVGEVRAPIGVIAAPRPEEEGPVRTAADPREHVVVRVGLKRLAVREGDAFEL